MTGNIRFDQDIIKRVKAGEEIFFLTLRCGNPVDMKVVACKTTTSVLSGSLSDPAEYALTAQAKGRMAYVVLYNTGDDGAWNEVAIIGGWTIGIGSPSIKSTVTPEELRKKLQ